MAVGTVARTGRPSAADAADIIVPRFVGMVLAHPSDPPAGRAVLVH